MKIHLAILESDTAYLKRIVSVFNMKYADKLEIYSFTNESSAMQSLKEAKIDVFLSSDAFEIDLEKIPPRCGFAYLVDASDVESMRGVEALCKFQKAELIYKHILNIFSEKTSAVTGIHLEENHGAKVVAFISAAGGTGCSTAAAACAAHFARNGKKVLYLNLEQFGSADVFFQGEGQGHLEDIIYTIKSKKGNLYLKLESTVKQDATGVFFFSAAPVALDMMELKDEEIRQILVELKTYCEYEYIILDFDFTMKSGQIELLKECYQIALIADGAVASNQKTERLLTALNILEQQNDTKLLMRTGILYNRFSSRMSQKITNQEIKEYGGIKRYEGFPVGQLLKELSELEVFDTLA
ncbi:MAG: chromosome partitioning protein ParA [Roseburia sp.]